jgi:arginine utilization protein RocB
MTLHYYSLHLQQHELDEEKEEEEEEEEKMNTPHPLPQRLLHGISSILVASTAKIVLQIAPFLLPVGKQKLAAAKNAQIRKTTKQREREHDLYTETSDRLFPRFSRSQTNYISKWGF